MSCCCCALPATPAALQSGGCYDENVPSLKAAEVPCAAHSWLGPALVPPYEAVTRSSPCCTAQYVPDLQIHLLHIQSPSYASSGPQLGCCCPGCLSLAAANLNLQSSNRCGTAIAARSYSPYHLSRFSAPPAPPSQPRVLFVPVFTTCEHHRTAPPLNTLLLDPSRYRCTPMLHCKSTFFTALAAFLGAAFAPLNRAWGLNCRAMVLVCLATCSNDLAMDVVGA